jgi:ribosome-associated heat shock protein Hsp15
MKNKNKDEVEVRLDKWLWAARFFKTRSMAHTAIEGGKVYVGKLRAKPSRIVSVGDVIEVTTALGQFSIIVEGLSSRRGSAKIAASLYRETEEGKARREELAETRRWAASTAPAERPNSRERKVLRRLKERS